MQYAIIIAVAAVLVVVAFFVGRATKKGKKNSQESDKEQTHFIYNLSHELRTPLNGLIGLCHLLDEYRGDEQQFDRYVQKIEETSERMVFFIDNLMEIAKLNEEEVELNFRPIMVKECIESIVEMNKKKIEEDSFVYNYEIDMEPECAMIDSKRVAQIINTLLDNAKNHSPQGGEIDVSVAKIKNYDQKSFLKIEVMHNGNGIGNDLKAYVLDSFYGRKISGLEVEHANCVDLVVVARLTKAMDGEFYLDSEKGKWSKFTVKLPLEESDASACQLVQSGSSDWLTEKKDYHNVLVVEDNELNAEIIMELFKEDGMDATHAHNGMEAVEMFEDSEPNEYDIILMDIRMPILDGFRATERIRNMDREDAKKVAIVGCSAEAMKSDVDKSKEVGMSTFLKKPVDADKLRQAMMLLDLGY